MIFLPIVERELLVGARRHGTFSVRLGAALAAILVSVLVFLTGTGTPRPVLAQRVFHGLAVVAMFYCVIAGRRLTADCISEEKREGTLGLLFLTDLKGYDVILGKLAATSLSSFYSLLAIFPVMAIPLLLGGITNAEFWRMVLVLVNTFLFSLAIGLVASALSRHARRAYGVNFILLLLLAGIPAVCGGAIAIFSPSHTFIKPLFFSCPIYSFYLSSDLNYRWQAMPFWMSVGVTLALTWGLLALASSFAPRSWQDKPGRQQKFQWREIWQKLIYGSVAKRKAFRQRLLEVNPFYWLAARARRKPVGVWLFLGFIACWWLFVKFVLGFTSFDDSFGLATAILLNCVLKLWFTVETAQRLSEEQKGGTLELLLSTPLSTGAIIRGQLLALRRIFLLPLLLILALEWFLIIGVSHYSWQADSRAAFFGWAGIIILLADLSALVGVAMHSALIARNPNLAPVRAIGRVLMLPWLVFGIIAALVNIACATAGTELPGWKFFLTAWFWLGIFTDLGFGLPAWWQLGTRFRSLALQRLGSSVVAK